MTGRSVESEVEVAVDPHTAFVAFTDEMDLWWVRSPISFYDSSRTIAKRCEPGVGGRILEIYDETTGDALETARFTAWDPGVRLAWRSSLDDVEIDVTFEPTASGTRVRVHATIPEGGADRGGTSWVRVTPGWFGAWCARRDGAPRTPIDLARLAVQISYTKPATAARWLHEVFDFEYIGDEPQDEDEGWIEFHVGNCALILFKLEDPSAEQRGLTHVPWVFVDDLDAHFEHARARGATIVEGIHQHGYRGYVAEDLEGNRWTFAQARPTMR